MAEGGHGGNTYASKTNGEMSKIKTKIGKANTGSKNGNATKLKSFDLLTHQTNHFGSFSEAIRFFGLPIESRKIHKLCSKNKKYGIEILFENRFIFAYESDQFNVDFIIKPTSDNKIIGSGNRPFGVFDIIDNRFIIKTLTKTELIKELSTKFNKQIGLNDKDIISGQVFEKRYKIQHL